VFVTYRMMGLLRNPGMAAGHLYRRGFGSRRAYRVSGGGLLVVADGGGVLYRYRQRAGDTRCRYLADKNPEAVLRTCPGYKIVLFGVL
jgi:hypothetical protein